MMELIVPVEAPSVIVVRLLVLTAAGCRWGEAEVMAGSRPRAVGRVEAAKFSGRGWLQTVGSKCHSAPSTSMCSS